MKHSFCLVAAFALTVIATGAQTTYVADGLKFTLDTSTLTASVSPETKEIATATIPAAIAVDGVDYTVTAVDAWAFYNCLKLITVTLPPSVRQVGSFAFANCRALESTYITDLAAWCSIVFANPFANPVYMSHDLYLDGELITDLVIPEDVTALGEAQFPGISAATVTIPAGVTEIGQLAFYQSPALESLTVPGSVKAIGQNAFGQCTALRELTFEPGVAEIGGYCFEGCTALESVTLPASIATIGTDAFNECEALQCVDIEDVTAWCNIAFGNDKANPLGYAHNLYCGGAPLEHVVIGDAVTTISPSIFAGCLTLRSLDITGEVTAIGENAFAGCTALETASLGTALTSIGNNAFEGCEVLSSVTIPATTTAIGQYAFYCCSALTDVKLPASLSKITDGMLGYCSGLTSLTIPESVTEIGFGALWECTGLAEIIIPDAVTRIGKSAFNGCAGLGKVTLGTGLTSLRDFVFSGCTALSEIVATVMVPPTATASTFPGYDATLWVPGDAMAAYAAADVWKEFKDVRDFADSVAAPVVPAGAVEIYDLQGNRVYSGPLGEAVLAPGIYVVRSGNRTCKIVI